MKRVSVGDIRQSYTREKARTDLICSLWGYVVLRPVSFLLTPLFVNLGFSANAVTALGLFPLIGGLTFVVLGAVNPFNFIVGAALINIWELFDHIDGNIARFRDQCSRFGELLDFIVGSSCLLLPVCLAVGLYLGSKTGCSMSVLGLEPPKWIWLISGAASSSAQLFRKVVSLRAQITTGKQAWKGDEKITIWVMLPRAILSLELPALMIASILGCLDLFLVGYAAYNLLAFPAIIIASLQKALLVDRQFHCKDNDS